MVFMTLEKNFREKLSFTLFRVFFFFVHLLPSFTKERVRETLSVLKEGALKHILRAKTWLYCLESVFWKVLIDFLFVVRLLFFFVTAYKFESRQFLIPLYRSIAIRKAMGYFSRSNGFHYF